MDKKQALKKLNAIEAEAKELRALIDAPVDIKERIKSYHDACEYLEVDPDDLPFEEPKNKEEKAINANWMMWIITQALNGEWKPDWSNYGQWKYYPWFDMETDASGVGFSYCGYDYSYSISFVGSRLCYANAEIAETLELKPI